MRLVTAHGIGGVRDLPVPEWLFVYGAALVVIVSFVALALLWERPLLAIHAEGHPLPRTWRRAALSPMVRIGVGVVSVFVFLVVAAAAFVGNASPRENIAPTFVYVVFWLGLVPIVVLVGNVWSVVNPWKAVADGVSWLVDRVALGSEPVGTYPESLGHWPAAALLFSFVGLELAYFDAADPRALGIAIAVYSAVTWLGAAWYGRAAWFRYADGFSVYFGFLARVAPLFVARHTDGRREVEARPPLVGLARFPSPPGTIAVVAVMLGSVGFDGVSRTAWWLDRRAQLREAAPDAFDVTGTLLNFAGLLLSIAAVAAAYLVAVVVARQLGRGRADVVDAFVGSLVPIALVYAVSHYFSLLLVQGQAAIRLASDPLGRGWDLFGTADYAVDLAPVSPNTIWYVQVGSLVAGHVAGLALAHDRALELFPPARRALKTQYPLLALMVLYTVGGLWLLAQD